MHIDRYLGCFKGLQRQFRSCSWYSSSYCTDLDISEIAGPVHPEQKQTCKRFHKVHTEIPRSCSSNSTRKSTPYPRSPTVQNRRHPSKPVLTIPNIEAKMLHVLVALDT